jgi:hypothetical protein
MAKVSGTKHTTAKGESAHPPTNPHPNGQNKAENPPNGVHKATNK